MSKIFFKKAGNLFTSEERHGIIKEYLSSGCSKLEIWQKYTNQSKERGHLLRWMRELGYDPKSRVRKVDIGLQPNDAMGKGKQKKEEVVSNGIPSEKTQLEKRIAQLEQQLKEAELKAIAFSTMVDIAEKEFKIPIRKKFSTKP